MSENESGCCEQTEEGATDGQTAEAETTAAETTERSDTDAATMAERSDADTAAPTDRWIDERPVVDASLPSDVARVMTRFYGAASVETLGDFVAATRAGAGGGVTLDDLCYVEEETSHVVATPDETYRFRCFYDGVALAHLADEPVDVRTESPSGTPIELRVSPEGELDASPDEAVMSFGIAADAGDDTDGDPTAEAVDESVCPYVKAFPSRERYRNWAAAVDGATVGLPLAAGAPIAAALTERA